MLMLTAMLVLGSCELIDRQSGSCYSGSIGDGGAVIDGSTTDPGDDGTIVVEGGDAADPDPVCARRVRDLCLESPAAPADPATPTVTVSDIARFAPAIPALSSQPGGWAVQDLPVNLLSPATTQVVEGTVLGLPASVRFIPVYWTWEFGDGATSSSTTGGARWEALGRDEFSATETSHVYGARGTYTVTAVIDFVVDYRIADGEWRPVAGVLSLPAPSTSIRVVRATTFLVAESCRENPLARGC